jgi:hypothetical protein
MKALLFIGFVLLQFSLGIIVAQTKSAPKKNTPKIDYKKLKAVIVLGPVDQEYDLDKKSDRMRVAAFLREKGVKVYEFYPPNDDWEKIKKACQGAHLFIYSGHGSVEGIHYPSGGLCLTKTIYGASEIINDLKFHKNALIIFNSACNSAGSSAWDSDGITRKEAMKRIEEYAYPFYKLNAGAYYANNYDNSVLPFLKAFFLKENAKEIYLTQASQWQQVEPFFKYSYSQLYISSVAGFLKRHPDKTNKVNSKTKELKGDFNAAFVGKPNFTVVDLFK